MGINAWQLLLFVRHSWIYWMGARYDFIQHDTQQLTLCYYLGLTVTRLCKLLQTGIVALSLQSPLFRQALPRNRVCHRMPTPPGNPKSPRAPLGQLYLCARHHRNPLRYLLLFHPRLTRPLGDPRVQIRERERLAHRRWRRHRHRRHCHLLKNQPITSPLVCACPQHPPQLASLLLKVHHLLPRCLRTYLPPLFVLPAIQPQSGCRAGQHLLLAPRLLVLLVLPTLHLLGLWLLLLILMSARALFSPPNSLKKTGTT